MNKNASFWAITCAFCGVALYGFLAFGIFLPPQYEYFGIDIYNAYFYRLLEGRFDLPLRMLTLEGHYSADGTGILYHGVAPLLTRAVLHPFVELDQVPVAAFSVWLWASIGTGFYHLALYQVAQKYLGTLPSRWVLLSGVAIWVCCPGFLLGTNSVLYHEPIAVAYAAMAVFVFLMVRCAVFELNWRSVLVPLAILACVLLHARPHLAVGAYLGVLAAVLLAGRAGFRRSVIPILTSILFLGSGGVSYLSLNETRFGSAVTGHGQISQDANVNGIQYGAIFLSSDGFVADRMIVFAQHGRFHPWRVLPNAALYTFDSPSVMDSFGELHRKVTEPVSGYGHIEAPRFGMLFVWPSWIALFTLGLVLGRPRFSGGTAALPLLLATGIAAALMLSYPTVAFRYRFDVWPFVMALCLLSLPGLIRRFGLDFLRSSRVFMLSVVVVCGGAFLSTFVAIPYSQSYQVGPGRQYAAWSYDRCVTRIERHQFSPERVAEICVDPDIVFEERRNR